jgi:hypothetical protein
MPHLHLASGIWHLEELEVARNTKYRDQSQIADRRAEGA